MRVLIANRQRLVPLDTGLRATIDRAAHAAMRAEGISERAELSVTLVSDQEIAELNRKYRGTEGPTDVLAFSLLEEEGPGLRDGEESPMYMLGDVVISVDTAREQAEEYGHSLERELALLTIHGVLHLLGYDDETEDRKQQMFARQEEILESVNLRG